MILFPNGQAKCANKVNARSAFVLAVAMSSSSEAVSPVLPSLWGVGQGCKTCWRTKDQSLSVVSFTDFFAPLRLAGSWCAPGMPPKPMAVSVLALAAWEQLSLPLRAVLQRFDIVDPVVFRGLFDGSAAEVERLSAFFLFC